MSNKTLAEKIRENPKQSFIILLTVCYAVGSLLHVLDLFDLRLVFSTMNQTMKAWIVYLLIADFITAILLWKCPSWGLVAFQIVAFTQLLAYWAFQNYFGRQDFLVTFHILTLATYWKIYAREQVKLHTKNTKTDEVLELRK